MVRVISQDTFNDVVKENMEEFSMTPEEAVEDAVKQFEAQGVDLSNILKAVSSNTLVKSETEQIDYTLSKLTLYVGSPFHPCIIDELKRMIKYCEQGIAYRMYVAKKNFAELCFQYLRHFAYQNEVKTLAFAALAAMVTDQPDVFVTRNLYFTVLHLEKESNPDVLVNILKLIKVCCIKHEENRQGFKNMHAFPPLANALHDHTDHVGVVKGVCSVFRALVLDDDIRYEFGHAHEHARAIYDCSGETLVELLQTHSMQKDVLGEILLTLCAIVVRNEYCSLVAEAGGGNGLDYVLDVFTNFPDSEKLNRTGLKFLKVLSGNDVVKGDIVRAGGARIIVDAVERHKASSDMTAAAFGCIAALTLRSPANAQCFAKLDAAITILDGMRAHPMDISVQKQGCWAIRNIVSRSRRLCPLFLENGAEELLNYVLEHLSEECEYDAKTALRDLGCRVVLREEWTGKGGALN